MNEAMMAAKIMNDMVERQSALEKTMMADKIMSEILYCSVIILIGGVLGGVGGSVAGASSVRGLYEHDTRKGTIVCETAESIIHEGRVYCITSEDTSDSRVESIY